MCKANCRPSVEHLFPINQLDRAVEFVFRDRSSFELTLSAPGVSPAQGRTFLLAGKTNLARCALPTPAPTVPPTWTPTFAFECPRTGEGRMDPSPFLAAALP